MAHFTNALQVGQVYRIELDWPECLNDLSPCRAPPREQNWFTTRASANTSHKRSHRRVGLVIGISDSGRTAVVLLSTSNPVHAHRYLPWLHSGARAGQPPHKVVPDPSNAFSRNPGYLNFTHAVTVTIMAVGPAYQRWHSRVVPGMAFLQFDNQMVVVPAEELDRIREFHIDYWNGIRYDTLDESTEVNQGGVDGGDGGDGGGGGKDLPVFVAERQLSASMQLAMSAKSVPHASDASDTSVLDVVERVLREDQMRNLQIDLMDGQVEYEGLSLLGDFQPLDGFETFAADNGTFLCEIPQGL